MFFHPEDWGDVNWRDAFARGERPDPLPDSVIDADPGDESTKYLNDQKFRAVIYHNYTTTELLGLTVWADELAALMGGE